MKQVAILTIVIFLLSATCCNDKDCHRDITIVNNSDKAIYFHPSTTYSDTLTLDYNPAVANNLFKVEKLSFKKNFYRSCIEGRFTISNKIRYFIYDAQTLESTPWDTVVKKYMILKRLDLSLEDLQKNNWTITYP